MIISEQGKVGQHSQTSKEGSESDPECSFQLKIRGPVGFLFIAKNTPNCMNELLVANSNMHMRNTRYCNLNFPCPRYNYATEDGRSFTVRSIKDWKLTPVGFFHQMSVTSKKLP